MINILLAILICIIILIALLCLGTFLMVLWMGLKGGLDFKGRIADAGDPISPEEQLRRRFRREEE